MERTGTHVWLRRRRDERGPVSNPAVVEDEIRVVLADDHSVLRHGLRQLLKDVAGFAVVAEAVDVPTTMRAVQVWRPDVLILDLNMPGGSSLDAGPELRRSPRRLRS